MRVLLVQCILDNDVNDGGIVCCVVVACALTLPCVVIFCCYGSCSSGLVLLSEASSLVAGADAAAWATTTTAAAWAATRRACVQEAVPNVWQRL